MTNTRILVVEDESIVARGIQSQLQSLGYTVVATIASGEMVVQQAAEMRPDLVLMDIQLQGELDGIQAAQDIHERFDIPVIYLTAYSDEATLQRAKITTPYGYILKPFQKRELHTAIEMALYNHQLEKQLRRQSEINVALAELSKALISSRPLDDIAGLVLEYGKRLTASRFGFVGYLDQQTGHFISATLSRDIWDTCQVANKNVIFEKFSGLWGWVLIHRQPLLTNAPTEDARSTGTPPGHIPIRRFLGVPALLDDTLVGMVALANADRDYTEDDCQVIERLAALYAVAVHRRQLENGLKEWNYKLEQRVIERTAQLQQSEARVRYLYENSPVMMHTTDEDEYIRDVNHQWLEETGYTREEIIGRPLISLMPPESAERFFTYMQQRHIGTVRDMSYQLIKKSGTLIEVLINTTTTLDPAGNLISLSVVRNVTEQKRAERQLRLQSTALAAAANAIVITNRDGRISWVNPAFTYITGYTFEEAVGQNMRLLKSGKQDQPFYKNLWDTILNGQVWQGELVNRHKDGRLYNEEQTITPLYNEDGEISHFIAIKQDITRRKQMEETLREINYTLYSLIEASPLAIIAVDAAGKVNTWNTAAERIFGWSKAEVLNAPSPIALPEYQAELPDLAAQELESKAFNGLELRRRRKDGVMIDVSLFASSLKDAHGHTNGMLGIFADITEQKRIQARIMHAERLSAVGKLAASVVHEINNPLQSILGCLGLAMEALAEGEDAHQYLHIAREEVRRIARIVARMRDLYRPESDKRQMSNVNELVEQVLELVRKRFQESRVEVEWKPTTDLPLLLLSPDQIKQVFLNLLLNALDAMPHGGQLQISTLYIEAPPGVAIRFQDSGLGISPEARPHIFEMFYTTKPEGSGLGLPISVNIVEHHGGRIDVESTPGVGSTFTVWLPA